MGVFLFETFFRSRHPFIACGEKLTGINGKVTETAKTLRPTLIQ
jgi:hypothetical protein